MGKKMQVEQLLSMMSDDIYEKFKQAIETGKWLDGNPLSDEQKEVVMQAVMLYQAKVEQSDDHMTVGKNGEIVQKSKSEFRQSLKQASTNENNIARFKQDDF